MRSGAASRTFSAGTGASMILTTLRDVSTPAVHCISGRARFVNRDGAVLSADLKHQGEYIQDIPGMAGFEVRVRLSDVPSIC
jgi:hypothetical protein